MNTPMPPDHRNEIGVLKRREIEARILMPVLEALGSKLGRERVFEVAREPRQGTRCLVAMFGSGSLFRTMAF